MSYDYAGASALDEETCHYGTSKLPVRGPERDLSEPYFACLGGTETFGRFVAVPFAVRLEARLGAPCVNLGVPGLGIDALLNDPELPRIAAQAELVILQLPGAAGLSNRLYRVHPRRNDRFLAASDRLRRLYPEVDFTEYHFVRHLLGDLAILCHDRFEEVAHELRTAWTARMRLLVERLGDNVVLLHLRYTGDLVTQQGGALGPDPCLVTQDMVSAIAPKALSVLALEVRPSGESEEVEDMLFGTLQQPAAEHLIGPATHDMIARKLFSLMQDLS
ncbi:DUF6473 family protein [Lutimaribacter marinistellae]|uniref:DUF6473 family protein n=1 Tax=Lutimaribacter marinistellae TaxID=1820329 RepID=A0ABV7TEX1_9RHOB